MQLYKEFEQKKDLLHFLLLVEEYQIPYEQQDLKVNIPENWHSKLQKIEAYSKLEDSQWVQFEQFNSQVALNNLIVLLDQEAIPYRVEEQTASQPVPGHISLPKIYSLIIELKNFDRLRSLRFQEAKKNVEYFEAPDYHLRSLNVEELIDVLENLDQWHIQDVVGAQHLLAELGHYYSDEDLENLRLYRQLEANRRKSISAKYLVGVYIMSVLFPIVGFFYGLYFLFDKQVLASGKKVYSYDVKGRKHGKIIFGISFLIILIVLLFNFFNQ